MKYDLIKQSENGTPGNRTGSIGLLLLITALAVLWARLIYELIPQWRTAENYSYCWGMPFVCVYLLWRRYRCAPPRDAQGRKRLAAIAMGLCCAALLPTLLVQGANPSWRLVSLAWTVDIALVCLWAVYVVGGGTWLRHFGFPICFFVVAVPWPSSIEGWIVQNLTTATTNVAVLIVRLFGITVMQHGNAIEVSGGIVAVTADCSGIRSMQASVMLALFFGEFYRLSAVGRIVCVMFGTSLAWLCNVGRTTFLTFVTALRGDAVERLHDPLGLAVSFVTLISCWVFAASISGRRTGWVDGRGPIGPTHISPVCGASLLAWIVFVELIVAVWYHRLESNRPLLPSWTIQFSEDAFGLKELPLLAQTQRLLKYDHGLSATWTDEDATRWQLIYLRWVPGPAAIYAANLHTPEVCLAAIGVRLEHLGSVEHVVSTELALPFQVFRFKHEAGNGFVFFCRLGDRGDNRPPEPNQSTWRQRLMPVFEGRPNQGMRVLELAVLGLSNIDEAEIALHNQLRSLIKWNPPGQKISPGTAVTCVNADL